MSAELNDLIRQVADEHPDVQPLDLATLVAEATPADLVKTFYTELLPYKIREIIGNERNRAISSVSSGKPLTKDRKTKPRKGKKTHPGSKKDTQGPVNISAKIAARRTEKWEKLFETQVSVNNKYKALGDLTVDDFDFIITDHHQRSDQILARGAEYQAYRDAVIEYKVDHFRELPDEALEALEAA